MFKIYFALNVIVYIFHFITTFVNLISSPKINTKNKTNNISQKISILIPMRNEEKNVIECLRSIYSQNLSNFEVIVLDDNSKDNTYKLLIEQKNIYPNLKIVKGESLPKGWLGKNWACWQLAQLAQGEVLIFIDADVRMKENSIQKLIEIFRSKKVKLLSVFPTQILKSFGERIIVPNMDWFLLSFLPLILVYYSKRKEFVAANGQLLMIDKNTYFNIGGHLSVKDKIVEDMEIARIIKSRDFKMITLLGNNLIYCKMYSNFKESFYGFVKNFYPGFSGNNFFFWIVLLDVFLFFLLPFILSVFYYPFLVIVSLILLQKTLISLLAKQNVFINIIYSPLQFLFLLIIGISSFLSSKRNRIIWKERVLELN